MRTRRFLAGFLCLATASPGWTVRHIDPDAYPPQAGLCRIKPRPVAGLNAQAIRAQIIGTASGAKTVAVIPVNFASARSDITTRPRVNQVGSGTQNSIQDCNDLNTYFSQMETYFKENSYNAITSITFKYFLNNGTVNGDNSACTASPITLPRTMEYYGCGDEYQGCAGVTPPNPGVVEPKGNYLIADALAAARSLHGNTPTARTSGGLFDAVIVVHAGNGNETTNGNGDIWSIFYSQDSIITSGGGGFMEGDVVPDTMASGITSPMGVMAHEFGHELGLPDLYNTGSVGGTSVVGDWDLMDSGPFTGGGANPSHIGAWGKVYLGWAAPQTVVGRGSPSITYSALSGSGAGQIVKLPVTGQSNEYFLFEYRARASGAAYDQNIPGSGLLVWHVDDSLTNARGLYVSNPSLANRVNTGDPHYGVSIVPANGIPIAGGNRGTQGNVFTATSNTKDRFRAYNNAPSGIIVDNIQISGATASFDVLNLLQGDSQSILKHAAYPNPAGKGKPHLRGEGWVTIQFQLSQQANNDRQVNLYTLSGDLVRTFGTDAINLANEGAGRSSDRRFVYEVDWDLTNGDGKHVAPGTYLYLIRADGLKKSGKVVVIR